MIAPAIIPQRDLHQAACRNSRLVKPPGIQMLRFDWKSCRPGAPTRLFLVLFNRLLLAPPKVWRSACWRWISVSTLFISLFAFFMTLSARAEAPFVQLDSPATTVGYLASLLINEVPFPGERGYESEADTRAAMLQILWVLDSRIHQIPPGYLQRHVAGVTSQDIIDIITGTGGRRQCEGFYRNASGQFVTDQRVQERIQNLLRIANSGGKPGHFAGLLNHAQGLARAYVKGGVQEADRYAGLKQVGPVRVTGHAYAWMTDVDANHPGGNFVTIPDNDDGSLGGNRFFTLKEVAK
jgi:hypothetical protein